MVHAVSGLNSTRFSGRVEVTPAFHTYGSPTVKGYASKELATMAASLNDRVVVRVDHVDGNDRVDLFLNKGFRELRPVQRSLMSLVPQSIPGKEPKIELTTSKPIPGNDLPFEFDAPKPVVSGKSFWGEWWAKRKANKATAANNKAFLGQVLAKAKFLSEWEDTHHLVGVPGLTHI